MILYGYAAAGAPKRGDIVVGQYEILDIIGSGSNAVTYRVSAYHPISHSPSITDLLSVHMAPRLLFALQALDQSGKSVALKCISLDSLKDWKSLGNISGHKPFIMFYLDTEAVACTCLMCVCRYVQTGGRGKFIDKKFVAKPSNL